MKKFTSIALLLAGLFVASQVLAQVESQDKAKDQKTEKQTNNNDKQPPAVISDDHAPGTTTTGTTTTGKPKSKKGTPANPQTGSMTTSASGFVQPLKIYDAQGEVVMTVDKDGWIRNPKNRLIAQYTKDGQYITKNRVVAGTAKDGVIRDKYGNVFARIGQDGKVTGAQGNLLGTIMADGTILDSKGKKAGSAPGVDKNVAAIVFFYSKPSLLNTGK